MINDLISPAPIFKKYFILLNRDKITSEYNFNEKDRLGQGSFGFVVKGVHKLTNQKRAIKIIKKPIVNKKISFKNEIEILKSLDHPNVIKLFETYEDDKLYLVMEMCEGGDLYTRISEKEHFSEKEARKVFYQIMSALNYCHLRHIAHRDLKLENILYINSKQDSQIKIIDFGFSKIFWKNDIIDETVASITKDKKQKINMKSKIGSAFYIAPEILEGQYDESCDIWSAGVILYIMLCGSPPFYGASDQDILKSVKRGLFTFNGQNWKNVSNEAKDLIKKCLIRSSKRLTASEVLSHKWMREEYEKKLGSGNILMNYEIFRCFEKHPKLKKIVLLFIASQLNEEEVSYLKMVFLNMDKNEDGSLDFEEFCNGLCNTGFYDRESIKMTFDAINMSKSGYINYNEFLAASIQRSVYNHKHILKSAYRVFDQKKENGITAEMLKIIFQSDLYYKGKSDTYWKNVLEPVDYNKDGKVDLDDFNEMMN